MKPGVELRGKQVLVVGLARTGVATALFCEARGAQVTATDTLTSSELTGAAAKLGSAGISLELGGHRRESLQLRPGALERTFLRAPHDDFQR